MTTDLAICPRGNRRCGVRVLDIPAPARGSQRTHVARDAANVVARLTFSRTRSSTPVVRLENLGPAVAEDVRLRMEFVTPARSIIVVRSVWVPGMAPGDSEPYSRRYSLPENPQGVDAACAPAALNPGRCRRLPACDMRRVVARGRPRDQTAHRTSYPAETRRVLSGDERCPTAYCR
jgi:hypothetical protein